MMAITGMDVKKERQGVFFNVGIATCVLCPRDCSIYISSLALMVGCLAGFSNVSHNQTKYQMMPVTPGKTQGSHSHRNCAHTYIHIYKGKPLNKRNFILKCMEKYSQRKILFRDTKWLLSNMSYRGRDDQAV